MLFAAVHESGFGTKRRIKVLIGNGRFGGEADVHDRAAWTASVADDPKPTSEPLDCCCAN
jgi:hypothetical protein